MQPQDISLISDYHPEVEKVELLSGNAKRAPGVEYKCKSLKENQGSG